MVLAREGAAAMGDLRYYADVKGDAFATPIGRGAAGRGAGRLRRPDPGRRDVRAGRGRCWRACPRPETEQVWRADYGTNFRDAAAVLTLAVEAGSTGGRP